jgi:hypothetical protein
MLKGFVNQGSSVDKPVNPVKPDGDTYF